MLFTGIKNRLIESNFGRILYNVKFEDIVCKKVCFPKVCGLTDNPLADIAEIRLYGRAIETAEKIKDNGWLLTENGFLVCSNVKVRAHTLLVNINIDENREVLSSYLFRQRVKPNYGFKVTIVGLDIIGSQDGMWCVFSEMSSLDNELVFKE